LYPQQWDYCGGVFRVSKVMRRIIDDLGKYRPVHRTVLLDGVCCGGVSETAGGRRHCLLMYSRAGQCLRVARRLVRRRSFDTSPREKRTGADSCSI
jgi:hypothetical protein